MLIWTCGDLIRPQDEREEERSFTTKIPFMS